MTRRCACCRQDLPTELFRPRSYWPDGTPRTYRSNCRPCDKAYRQQREVVWAARRQQSPVAGEPVPRLAVAPFRGWLASLRAKGHSLYELTRLLALSDSTLRKILNGSQKWIGLDQADRAFVRMGEPWQLAWLYPLEDEPAVIADLFPGEPEQRMAA